MSNVRALWRFLTPVAFLSACGGIADRSTTQGSDAASPGAFPEGGTTEGGTAQGGEPHFPDAAACDPAPVLASHEDLSCTTDADCTWVPPGGDPCSGPLDQGFICNTAPISVNARDGYLTAIQAAKARKTWQHPISCPALSSPPFGPTPTCCAGVCATATDCHAHAGPFACGAATCDGQSQICRHVQGGPAPGIDSYACSAIPAPCANDVTCRCVQAALKGEGAGACSASGGDLTIQIDVP